MGAVMTQLQLATPPEFCAAPVSGNAEAQPRYEIDTDQSRLDLGMIHDFLSRVSHWAKGIPFAVMKRAIENSVAFGLYRDGKQIGFARVVTDHATFAYLADVFVLDDARNGGLGQWLIESILACPDLQGMRRWLLGTRNAQSLYRRAGFSEPPPPFTFMEKLDPNVYGAAEPCPVTQFKPAAARIRKQRQAKRA
jgi:N-acetylglutamate synthase-like GNAT family acetyltransferase